MALRRPHRSPHRSPGLAALLALAVLLRLLVPAGPMPAMPIPPGTDPVLAELLSGGGICHADPGAPGKPAIPGSLACLLCPLCAAPAPLLASPAPPLPLPRALPVATATLWPPATAPPAAEFRPANPRAPPARLA
jgi:hypothetical protein